MNEFRSWVLRGNYSILWITESVSRDTRPKIEKPKKRKNKTLETQRCPTCGATGVNGYRPQKPTTSANEN